YRRFSSCRLTPRPPSSPLFPYTTLFRSCTSTSCPEVATGMRRTATSSSSVSTWTPEPSSTSLAGPGTAQRQGGAPVAEPSPPRRSEEHTSELQSRENLVCRLLLEKKKAG